MSEEAKALSDPPEGEDVFQDPADPDDPFPERTAELRAADLREPP